MSNLLQLAVIIVATLPNVWAFGGAAAPSPSSSPQSLVAVFEGGGLQRLLDRIVADTGACQDCWVVKGVRGAWVFRCTRIKRMYECRWYGYVCCSDVLF